MTKPIIYAIYGIMRKVPSGLISAMDIAKEFHISYQLVNYYTNIGLFKVCGNRGNKRLYSHQQVAKNLKKIKKFKQKGYSLRVIRDELL